MNEIDLKTKIEGLEKAIAEHKDFMQVYEGNLKDTQKQLKDYNKIALPPIMFDEIYEAVEEGINNFDWSDTDNYNIEYGIEYDGKVHCESHEINNTTDLVEAISEKVCRLFKEADAPEDDNSQVNTHTVAEKII